jgi:hypothetical protein
LRKKGDKVLFYLGIATMYVLLKGLCIGYLEIGATLHDFAPTSVLLFTFYCLDDLGKELV